MFCVYAVNIFLLEDKTAAKQNYLTKAEIKIFTWLLYVVAKRRVFFRDRTAQATLNAATLIEQSDMKIM